MITEPKQVNSGTPQGAFLKRQMALKMDDRNSPYMPDDFCIGLDIGIYGRQFRIYDCDQWTRQFYEVSNLSSTKTKAKKEISFRTFLLDSFK